MPEFYHRTQGLTLDRLASLSDDIFAVAMTLLVLELKFPATAQVHSEKELLDALGALAPQWMAYFMSFLTLAVLWAAQQMQLDYLAESTRDLAWIYIGFLFTITFLPLSTGLLANFFTFRVAMGVYWLNLIASDAMLNLSWSYAWRTGLIKPDTPAEVRGRIRRGIVTAQALYTVGAALSFIHMWVSIAVIIAVQLNFVLAPRWRSRNKLSEGS